MSIVKKINHKSWDKWVKSRPKNIQILCKKLPPDRLYKIKSTGQRVTILSYSEDNTVKVDITGEYNLLPFNREVFGIQPDDLEECDCPEEEILGVTLTNKEAEDYINNLKSLKE